jgi:hypothetical protein
LPYLPSWSSAELLVAPGGSLAGYFATAITGSIRAMSKNAREIDAIEATMRERGLQKKKK